MSQPDQTKIATEVNNVKCFRILANEISDIPSAEQFSL